MITNYYSFALLILLSSFFSGSETSFFSLNNIKLENIKIKNPKIGKIIETLLNRPQKLLVTILICNIFVNISATLVAIKIFPSWIAIPLVTVLIIIFGEITPKTLAIRLSSKISVAVAPIFYFLLIILTPLSFIFHKITRLFVEAGSKIFYREYTESTLYHTSEMLEMIKESERHGVLDDEESSILANIIKFPDSDIYKIIKPRNEIFALSIDLRIEEIIEKIKERRFSRIPVWENNEENIVGILYVKDLHKIKGTKRKLKNYKEILRKPFFIPETVKSDQLLKSLQSTNNHMAIVIDEYGSISGIVTLEDVLEEIVGEVVDKDDVVPLYYKYNNAMIEVEARMEINELNKVFKTNIRSKETVTVGGYILEKIQRIPSVGEIFVFNNLQFKISGAMANKIEKIMITRITGRKRKKSLFGSII